MTYLKIILALLTLSLMSPLLSGCTVTAHCYGYGCDVPYNYGFDSQRFMNSGTEQPTYRHYRPW